MYTIVPAAIIGRELLFPSPLDAARYLAAHDDPRLSVARVN